MADKIAVFDGDEFLGYLKEDDRSCFEDGTRVDDPLLTKYNYMMCVPVPPESPFARVNEEESSGVKYLHAFVSNEHESALRFRDCVGANESKVGDRGIGIVFKNGKPE